MKSERRPAYQKVHWWCLRCLKVGFVLKEHRDTPERVLRRLGQSHRSAQGSLRRASRCAMPRFVLTNADGNAYALNGTERGRPSQEPSR